MKKKAINLISKFKYEFAVFLLLSVQACINIDLTFGMNPGYYSYYLADFSMGKTSRLLIGSLVNLLTDHPTVNWINCFAAVVLFSVFVFTSILIGKIIKSADKELRPCIAIFSLFFVSGVFTINSFSKFFGLLDVYMYVFAVASVLVAKNKYLKWFIPVLCVGGVMINYVFPISYFLLVAMVLIYLIFTEEKKTANITILLISGVVSVALMFFCVFYGKFTATVTLDEMWQIMERKLGMELEYDHLHYYDYYLLGNKNEVTSLGYEMQGLTPVEYTKAFFDYMFNHVIDMKGIISVAIGAAPLIVTFGYIWIKCVKFSETKGKKFVYLCFMLSTLGILVCCLTSTDLTRWTGAGIIVQFCLGYYMFKEKDKPFEKVMYEIKTLLKDKALFIGMVYIVYASTVAIYSIES